MKISVKEKELSKESIYVADPIENLCILGGQGLLAPEEAGPLDTAADADMAIKDLRRLERALPDPFKANVAARGVNVPIIIAMIGGAAVVVEGKSRVRAARAANRMRAQEGLPLMKIRCVVQRDQGRLAMLGTMISANNARMEDDFLDRLEKLKSYLGLGGSEEDAALHFNVGVQTIKNWLAFEDQATEETKQAVRAGQLGASAAVEMARIRSPQEQNKKLARLLAKGDTSVRAARQARGAKGAKARTGKKDIAGALATVQAMSHAKHSDKALAFWEGVEEGLKWVLGQDVDERLKGL